MIWWQWRQIIWNFSLLFRLNRIRSVIDDNWSLSVNICWLWIPTKFTGIYATSGRMMLPMSFHHLNRYPKRLHLPFLLSLIYNFQWNSWIAYSFVLFVVWRFVRSFKCNECYFVGLFHFDNSLFCWLDCEDWLNLNV